MNTDNLKQHIIETADEYHAIAEEQWAQAVDIDTDSNEVAFEFRRLIRAATLYYCRACLILAMVGTDAEQELEDLLEIVAEQDDEIDVFFRQNRVAEVLDEESQMNLSRVFAVAESVRTLLLQHSNQLAASLDARFEG
ncbi:MAG: hypothetical protein IPM61_02595 [Chlorobi bacterium]|nr:MAG: hypothetical protein UZ07_CHB004002978 [Chlorobi bacterium OLB7]MBK8910195.1 hypothetical protein [Chlorobiota bacterium]MBX7217903.1 hypothetical protein [Candidatus Kapabacteria bacterium]MCE7936058.1 hypothetical protein [Chlorobi bacterium CHB2]